MRAEKKVQQKKDDVKTFSELPCTTLAFEQTFLTMFHPFADDRLEWQELEKAPEELHGYHGKFPPTLSDFFAVAIFCVSEPASRLCDPSLGRSP
ncbi:hypothetical protein RUM43_000271 [Polyplax serrata]|uniref:Uncharacterized protein n=1 Tax=Polyplax serrata TaxID=468196 RepID=A0AAN8XQ57_POLSC